MGQTTNKQQVHENVDGVIEPEPFLIFTYVWQFMRQTVKKDCFVCVHKKPF